MNGDETLVAKINALIEEVKLLTKAYEAYMRVQKTDCRNTWHEHEPDWTHPLIREDRPE
jgi:hypothetical protein